MALPYGVTGNTPDFGSGESRFEPWWGSEKKTTRSHTAYCHYMWRQAVFFHRRNPSMEKG